MSVSRRIASPLVLILATITVRNTPCQASQGREGSLGEVVQQTTGRVWYFLHAKNGDHWFGSPRHGAYRYHEGTLTLFTKKDGLPDDRVYHLAEDGAGNVLIATASGVARFDGKALTPLVAVDSNDWAIGSDDVWMTGEIGENMVYRYTEGKLLRYRLPPHDLDAELGAANPNPVADPYGLYTLYRDRSGSLWFGTAARGAFRFDGKSLGWFYLDHLTNTPNGGSFGIRSILEDHEGNFWICNTKSRFTLASAPAQDSSLHRLRLDEKPGIASVTATDGSNRIYFQSIVEDAQHDLWLLTYRNGIWRYDGKSMKQYVVRDGENPVDLFSLDQDSAEVLWVGTDSAGVYRFDGTSFVPFRP